MLALKHEIPHYQHRCSSTARIATQITAPFTDFEHSQEVQVATWSFQQHLLSCRHQHAKRGRGWRRQGVEGGEGAGCPRADGEEEGPGKYSEPAQREHSSRWDTGTKKIGTILYLLTGGSNIYAVQRGRNTVWWVPLLSVILVLFPPCQALFSGMHKPLSVSVSAVRKEKACFMNICS